MGRSLKEALLDQYALLQERGLAPSEMPQEDDAPLVVVESASRGGRAQRGRRDGGDRFGADGEDLLDGQFDRDRRRVQRRERVGGDEARERRRPAPARGRGRPAEFEPEFAAPAFGGGAGPRGPRPPMGGPRGPLRPGMGAPRPGAPGMVGPGRPPARTAMMQQRAEQRRRDDEDIAEIRRLLAELKGQEMDDTAMDEFSRAVVEETGALPPPRVMVEAIKEAKSADPRKLGDAVRAYYRRRRPRPPMPAAAGAPPREAAAASA